jgi:hypothetical protein
VGPRPGDLRGASPQLPPLGRSSLCALHPAFRGAIFWTVHSGQRTLAQASRAPPALGERRYRSLLGPAAAGLFGAALPFCDRRSDGVPVGLGNSCRPLRLCKRPTVASAVALLRRRQGLGARAARNHFRQPGQTGRAAVLLDYVLRPAWPHWSLQCPFVAEPGWCVQDVQKTLSTLRSGRHRQLSQRLSASAFGDRSGDWYKRAVVPLRGVRAEAAP